jgi:hypothetical protein
MQLWVARLCHDCDEVHADQQCPVCASETFTYIKRWVPAPERRKRPRPETSPEAEIYRQLTEPREHARPLSAGTLLKRAVLGMTAVGVAGWLLERTKPHAAGTVEQRRVAGGGGDNAHTEMDGEPRRARHSDRRSS